MTDAELAAILRRTPGAVATKREMLLIEADATIDDDEKDRRRATVLINRRWLTRRIVAKAKNKARDNLMKEARDLAVQQICVQTVIDNTPAAIAARSLRNPSILLY